MGARRVQSGYMSTSGGNRHVALQSLPALSLAALGIVYGDIGTSPLYAFKVAVQAAAAGGAPVGATAIGIASLIIWALIVIVSLKYALLILQADNHGEGGVMAMLALLGARDPANRRSAVLLVLGLVGAALLYGDGAITPAISVLSAVEGLEGAAPHLARAILPVTIAILVMLFLVQSRGTGLIGRVFGPVMLIWFLAIGALGVASIAANPAALAALCPLPALECLRSAPATVSFAVLGAVFLP